MSSYPDLLIERYRANGALIDTNLLLLLLVGSYDPKLVAVNGFKRVAKYTVEDLTALLLLLKQFRIAVTTPHILTEVSNLAGQLSSDKRFGCFATFLRIFRDFQEVNIPSFEAAARVQFPRLGLTDCVLAEAASEYLVISDDLRLVNELENLGLTPLNFNHVRTLAWQ